MTDALPFSATAVATTAALQQHRLPYDAMITTELLVKKHKTSDFIHHHKNMMCPPARPHKRKHKS
jgi:hypothetical protein